MGARFVNVISDFGILHAGLHRAYAECTALVKAME